MKRKAAKRLLAVLLAASMVSGISGTMGIPTEIVKAEDGQREAAEEVLYLSDMEWERQTYGAETDFPNGIGRDTAINGDPIRLRTDGSDRNFEKGIGTHAPSEIVISVAGKGCVSFEAYAGVDLYTLNDHNNNNQEGSIANFIVEADGTVIGQSGEMNPSMNAYHFDLKIPEGTTQITLKVESGAQTWSDWADWGDAKFIVDSNAVTPEPPEVEIESVEGNNISIQVKDGTVKLYRKNVLVAESVSMGKVSEGGRTISDFRITDYTIIDSVATDRGEARRLILELYSSSGKLKKTIWYDLLKEIDGAVFTTTFLEAESGMEVTEVIENEFRLFEPDAAKIWSYNGGGEGPQSYYDTLQKVENGFYRENKQDDTSVGIPVADIYSVKGGVTVGDGALHRRFLTTPVSGGNNSGSVSIHWKNQTLEAGIQTEVGTSIVGIHSGDYYSGLRTYADVMAAQGFSVTENIPKSSYDLRWESWGWESAWTIDKILEKLDTLYAQGIRQITLDDCWYTAAGDWQLNPNKFPNGVADMKRLTDAVHAKGMTVILWWRPMDGGRDSSFVEPWGFTQQPSRLLSEHPEYFVKNADGSFAKLSGPGKGNQFNGSTGYALCPQSKGAVESQVAFIRRAMTEWGIDGFKSDYVWGMPKCYNEAHHHAYPEESTETASEIFYKAIYEEMVSIDNDAFHLLCNCGVPQDYYSLPYVTQIPTADPTSVDQTRRRVKAYKALTRDDFPITTDHNEIWYPSSVGTGAVLIEKRDFEAGSAAEQEYYKWLAIADEHKLQEGTHIGTLYAYGIDPYETYVIQKDEMMYYSFYRDGKYAPSGKPAVTLKGLKANGTYRIEDYVNNKVIAEKVTGAEATFTVDFSQYLLLRAVPLEEAPDIEGLETAIREAEAVVEKKTVSSTVELRAKIKEARMLTEDSSAEEVKHMIEELQAAMTADVLKDRGNTDALKKEIAAGTEKKKEDYTAESWNAYEKALEKAEKLVQDNSDSTQEDVDRALEELLSAKKNLKEQPQKPEEIIDKTSLYGLIAEAKSLENKDYTEESWEELQRMLAEAEKIADKKDAVQKEVDEAAANLKAAIANLKEKPVNPDEPVKLPYEDIKENQWYTGYVEDVYVKKLMTGMSEKIFAPEEKIARAQFAAILYRMEGAPEVEFEKIFPDVNEKDWFAKEVTWAYKNGIITGYEDTKLFGPSDYINREQMAVMLHRYAKYKKLDVSEKETLLSFPDNKKVNDFAEEAVQWCVAEGIISGKENGAQKYLDPQGYTIRAEAAAIISRYSELTK